VPVVAFHSFAIIHPASRCCWDSRAACRLFGRPLLPTPTYASDNIITLWTDAKFSRRKIAYRRAQRNGATRQAPLPYT